MKIICNICHKEFEYPFEQMKHRHSEYELDLVPPNFWSIKDERDLDIVLKDGQIIKPDVRIKSSLKSGNTPLIRYKSNVYLKDESLNPTGSFKDRGMENIMNEIVALGKKKVAVVSCGSGAISIIRYAKEYKIKSVVFVNKDTDEGNMKLISNADELFISEDFIKSYEDFIKYCYSHDDIFCGFLNTNISYMLGLRTMSYEIIRDLKSVPDVVVIPCGSGMDIVSQNLAFRQMYRQGIISKIPKIAVVEIDGGNPIRKGFEAGDENYLHIINPVESKTILSNDTCFNYKKIYDIAKRGEAFFVSVTDDEIDNFISHHLKFSKRYDYSSLSAMAALEKIYDNNHKYVVILTCKNRKEK